MTPMKTEYKPHDYRYPRTTRQAFGNQEYRPLRKDLSFLQQHRGSWWSVLAVVGLLLLAASCGG
jgi:hypothetical protein